MRVRTLSQVGTAESLSEQGRELYVATVGTGPRAAWVQGRIHDNEPYGLESILWDRENDVPRLRADGSEQRVDLNRDWRPDGFVARESLAWYEYWTMVRPEYALDIHHQGLKRDPDTGDPITFSLGISLHPVVRRSPAPRAATTTC